MSQVSEYHIYKAQTLLTSSHAFNGKCTNGSKTAEVLDTCRFSLNANLKIRKFWIEFETMTVQILLKDAHVRVVNFRSLSFLGGVRLTPYETQTVNFPDHWSGRVWARTGCGSGSCETGDCGGGKFKCNGAGGIPPATLAEITFDGYGGLDYYDVSLVDGYNVKMAMSPKPGTYQSGSGTYYCTRAGCNSDLNVQCPAEQMKIYGRNGQVVACKSA